MFSSVKGPLAVPQFTHVAVFCFIPLYDTLKNASIKSGWPTSYLHRLQYKVSVEGGLTLEQVYS